VILAVSVDPERAVALQSARDGAGAVALSNGQVLFPGGSGQTAELYYSAPQAAVASGDFGDETVAQASPPSALIVTNVGAQTLSASAAALGGTDAGDFAITADHCSGKKLGFDASCTITARFMPSATGPESATIALSDNEATSTTIALSGTGAAANSGPAGATGPTGGTNGRAVPRGTPGSSSWSTASWSRRARESTRRPSRKHDKLTNSPVKFTTSGTALAASLGRGKIVYATGSTIRSHARIKLLLTAQRALVRGSYTLTLTHRRRRQREKITIG
jgi:hypothetical protein